MNVLHVKSVFRVKRKNALIAEQKLTVIPNLSDYSLFVEPTKPTEAPRAPGINYQLSTELFSNYASKYRFVFLPENQQMKFMPQQVFQLPVGSVLVKSFALPFDTQSTGENNEKLIETRLMIHREAGWTALTYQWQQDNAELIIAGADVTHTLNNQGESMTFDYHIPSKVECKICHQINENDISRINPIGLKAHLLNLDIPRENANPVNQLNLWSNLAILADLPDLDTVDKSFSLINEAADLTNRAKGYLDINCAHCHNEQGFASISGLRLSYHIDHTSFKYGVCKQPPGWDGGPNGLAYDIVPGNAEQSILHYRQVLSAPKDKMPPIGREIVHSEGTELVKRWIDNMSANIGTCQ
ncbi:SO2930 family diheme c-type cytochrome [Shewanella sp. TC10]|uniref:SO2930 family diheme c-type cytochrome n=1 Tax=Shewanella sp. TC10 TaxID=1419739 RepID=UPI00129D2716|nr:SO2930 family diheme c-type cytochrome [Shewanella sp. TC10]